MKEATLIDMQKKIDILGKIVQNLYVEFDNLKMLSYGTHETVKNMPGYKEALDVLKEQMKEQTKMQEILDSQKEKLELPDEKLILD